MKLLPLPGKQVTIGSGHKHSSGRNKALDDDECNWKVELKISVRFKGFSYCIQTFVDRWLKVAYKKNMHINNIIKKKIINKAVIPTGLDTSISYSTHISTVICKSHVKKDKPINIHRVTAIEKFLIKYPYNTLLDLVIEHVH